MDCETFARYLDLYLDGELAIEERAEIEAHLKQCPSCRDTVRTEIQFRTGLRRSLQAVRAPSSLREEVIRRIHEQRRAQERFHFLPALTYAVAVVMLAVIGYTITSAFEDSLGADIEDSAVAVHRKVSNTEIYGRAEQVKDFLDRHAPFAYRLPLQDREGVRLVGARLTRLASRPAVAYEYDINGRRVTVVQYRTAKGDATRPRLRHRGPFVIATYGDRDLTQTMVGELPEPEVRRFVPASFTVR